MVLQNVDFNVIFDIIFLKGKVIALIIQQVLYKNNILVPPSLPTDRFVFNIYVCCSIKHTDIAMDLNINCYTVLENIQVFLGKTGIFLSNLSVEIIFNK